MLYLLEQGNLSLRWIVNFNDQCFILPHKRSFNQFEIFDLITWFLFIITYVRASEDASVIWRETELLEVGAKVKCLQEVYFIEHCVLASHLVELSLVF